MKPSSPRQTTAVTEAPLSPQWAFVVQFRAALDGGPPYAVGRVEHLPSGRTAHFQSLAELATYFAEALRPTSTEP